jgi:hypothetical protein
VVSSYTPEAARFDATTTAPRLAVIAVTGYPDRVLFADPSDRHVVKAIFPKPVDPVDVAAYIKSRCSRES